MILKKNSVALVLPMALDPSAGGVQRIAWNLGEALISCKWKVYYISLSSERFKTPSGSVLDQPSFESHKSTNQLLDFVKNSLNNRNPSIIINFVGLDKILRKVLWHYKVNNSKIRIVSCFLNNPCFYKDNVSHILSSKFGGGYFAKKIFTLKIISNIAKTLHLIRSRNSFITMYNQCDIFMVLSPTFIEELRWYLGNEDLSKVVAIPPPVSLGINEIKSKKNIFLFVARIEDSQKNVFLLPKIWKKIQNLVGNWELHIVGEGSDLPELKNRFFKDKLDRVFIHGKVDSNSFFAQSKIFLMLSAFEGFGVTLAEAQANCVVPIAFESFSAIHWILNHNKDAILVPAFDLDRYANELVLLSKDDSRLYHLQLAAFENSKRFSTQVVSNEWIGLLNKLAKNHE